MMIFTIGHQKSYDEALEEFGRLDTPLIKKGRSDSYPGGYAFRTADDAARRIAQAYAHRGFAVYEVNGDWERDTYPSPCEWWHHLKVDRPIIGRYQERH